MVKHPRYQAQDVGRMEEIPRAFKRFCPSSYKLDRIEPKESDGRPGPIPRPTFRVVDEEGRLMALFHPYGHSECHSSDFKDIYDKMVQAIEQAGFSALQEYERNSEPI